MKKVYLDNNATTPLNPQVLEAMLPYFKDIFGNASSLHSFGQKAKEALETSRRKVASGIGAKPEEVIFTSGGTESNNFAIKGSAYAKRKKGNHIITSSVEHHAVLNVCKYLQKEGFEVTYLPVDQYGRVSPDDLKAAIRPETILITIMWANNETGTIQPVEEIGEIAENAGICFHTDAVQAFGKVPMDVDKIKADLLSISAHKIHGPKGVGALYIKRGTKITSLLQGGHHERHKRAGTENVPGIVGLGKACRMAKEQISEKSKKIKALRDKLQSGLEGSLADVQLNGHPEERLPNTLNMSFNGVEGESLILNLDMQGVAVSTGSACTSGSLEPSHVLKAMGVPPHIAQGSLRFSLGEENSQDDIEYVLEVLPPLVKKLRKMSPIYNKGA